MVSPLRVLAIEPFGAGSHGAFLDALRPAFTNWTECRMPGRHWKWRMRGSAPWLALAESDSLRGPHDVLLATSYLALAELRGLVPSLAEVPAVLYFHENQLAFPDRPEHSGERDAHYGMTQLVSALAADRCAFNSRYNRDSFLAGGRALLARMPDHRPPGWIETLEASSVVLPLPVPVDDLRHGPDENGGPPTILWNHRWEHDKDPEAFFAALFELEERGVDYRLVVCGQRFSEAPPIFELARRRLAHRTRHFGTLPDRESYARWLRQSDLVVSTARQEFFGVSVVEAVAAGARPVLPRRLVYPELWPEEFLYDDGELCDVLARSLDPASRTPLRADRAALIADFLPARVVPRYVALLEEVAGAAAP